MKIWKNTSTLDNLSPLVEETGSPEEAELAVLGSRPLDLEAFPRLRALFKCGVGTDNIPFAKCRERGILIGMPSEATKTIIYEETANFTVFLLLRQLYQDVGNWGKWEKRSRPFLGDQKILLIGQGNIGRRVREKLSPLCRVLTYDIIAQTPDALRPLMQEARAISLHIPLNDVNRGFLDAEKLSWLPDGAIVVNTSRGPIIEEMALHRECASGRLRAALDVFWQEPYQGPLADLPEPPVYRSPHVASTCEDFLRGLARDLEAFHQTLLAAPEA